MKKNSLIIIFSIAMITMITYFNFKVYSSIYNEKLLSVINEVVENNPGINIEDVINGLNNSAYDESILEEYGYDKSDFYLTSDIKDKFHTLLVLNIIIVIFLVAFSIKIFSHNKKGRKKEIEELINYLEKINNGIYGIDLERYTEGEFSRLRDQIYKTTILLKENENKLLSDKKNLKNNLADISHQLKTPLTSIMLMLENITEDDKMTTKKRKEYISKVSNQVDKMKYLIEVLVKVSKLDASVVEFKKGKVKAGELINKVILNLDYLIEEKNIVLNLSINPETIIMCDKKWQEEALTNILKNSIENSFEQGIIDIDVRDNNFYSSIIIKDYGKGISEKMQKKIFERFKKSEESNGIGIGLNLAKTIIEKDSGIITVDSVLSKYTKFEIKYMKNK